MSPSDSTRTDHGLPEDPRAADPRAEAKALLAIHQGHLGPCLASLAGQFTTIQSRGQLLLTLATLTLTITGFSGPTIAASGLFARWSMILGLVMVLVGVILLLVGSLRIRWSTQFLETDPETALALAIRHRNRKTIWYHAQLTCIVVGLAGYVMAVLYFLVVGGLVHLG